ncbi:MAG: hypothetical protein ABEJ83_05480 [Candidatus Nanohaloarchaea archaeon]
MATVSARVPDELKEKISEENISLSPVIRKALEKELEKKRRDKLREDAEELSKKLPNLETSEVTESVREDRKR